MRTTGLLKTELNAIKANICFTLILHMIVLCLDSEIGLFSKYEFTHGFVMSLPFCTFSFSRLEYVYFVQLTYVSSSKIKCPLF